MSLAAPDSEVDICNMALTHLKQKHIVQIDPPSTQPEEHCALWYHQTRQARLRSHPWNFALKRVQLLPSATEPLFGFTHQYLFPTDWIRYVGRYDSGGFRVNPDDYDIEGRYILLNGEDNASINVRYVSDFQQVSKMDALFKHLFALDLALVLAPLFSSGENRVKVIMEMIKDAEAKATAIDGQERPPRRVQRSKFIEARRGSGRGSVAGSQTFFQG